MVGTRNDIAYTIVAAEKMVRSSQILDSSATGLGSRLGLMCKRIR